MNKEKIIKIADKIIEYSIYGLILFIPISKAGVGIFCVLAIVAFFVKKSLCPDFSFIRDNKSIYIFLFLFVVFMAMSLLNSGPYLAKGLRALGGKWVQYIFIFIIVADTLKTSKRIRNAVILMLSVAGLVVLSGYSQKFLGFEVFRGRPLFGGVAVTGSFENPNDFAAYLVLPAILALSVSIINFKNKIYGFFVPMFVFLSGGALLLTLSRGAWMGFLLGGVLLAIIIKKYRHIFLFLILFLVGIASLPVASARVMNTFASVRNSVSNPAGGLVGGLSEASAESSIIGDPARIAIWRGAIAMIKENPFLGKGLGTFMDRFSQYVPSMGGSYYAHNCYLQIWAESGVFSLIAFLCFVGFIFWRSVRFSFLNRQNNLGLICGGLTAGLFGFLVHSFLDTQLYSLQLKTLFWVTLGMLQAMSTFLSAEGDKGGLRND
ncbi:MAG: O-antigen ligase family protein [Candidatus Omnitrophica bacterium]|nr:O-antigen ligase family protein [Candidatus Omnitrophota bacterium]